MTNPVPTAEAVFELEVTCAAPTPLGRVNGGNAMMIPITGGTITGERLSGTVLAGGADWAVKYDNGIVIIDARYAMQASDGTIIQVFNGGSMRFDSSTGAPPPTVLTSPRFIAPEGPHDWLNHGVFVGTLRPDTSNRSSVHIVIFQMR